MRSLKSGLFAIALSSLVGTAAVVGCSADGGGTGVDDTAPAPTDTGSSGSVVPPKTDPPATDAGKDSGKKDSGPKPEAGVDAGPPPPVEGTACPTLNAIAQKNCGACGKAETVCLAGAGDGGGGTWSPYGLCGGELAGGCTPAPSSPRTAATAASTKTCTQYCAYTLARAWVSPPTAASPARSITRRPVAPPRRTATEPAPRRAPTAATPRPAQPVNANKMTISGTVGGVVTAGWTLAASQVARRSAARVAAARRSARRRRTPGLPSK